MSDETIGAEGADAPIGTEIAGTEGSQQTPAAIDVDDNTLIRVKGSDKPIKYGEAFKGFQSQFTKASQKAAELERRLAEREERLRSLEQSRQAQPNTQGGTKQALEALRQLPYVSGEQQAQIVVGVAQALEQRDKVIGQMARQLGELKQYVGTLYSNHTNSSFDTRIANVLKEGGYPPEAAELAKEIYLAYEGDDLDEEFPAIFANRWKQIQGIVEASRRAQLTAAKRNPFLPGKGGNTGPTKPMTLKGSESPAKIADDVWEAFLGKDSGT